MSADEAPRALDEETIELVRRQIGIPVHRSPRHQNEVSSVDSFRHFARGYGDDNPLYGELAHGAASPWGSPIAPPLYPYSAGVMRPVEWTPAEREIMAAGDPLRGIGQYMCGDRWIFTRPIRPGDVLHRSQSLFAADLKQSTFGGGTGALVSHRVDWEADDGTPFAYRYLDFWHADRDRSRKTGKYREITRPAYTDEDLARIDACYESEALRGAKPRPAMDVAAGDELGPIAKGPMAVTDVIAWHVGTGMGDFGVAALKLGYQNRRRVPAFYQKNELGHWDAAMRAHWDQAWAERLGQPAPYDYGVMRGAWLSHLVTNWMGDGAWLWQLSTAVRRFNHIGDTHFVTGTVHAVDTATSTVTIDLAAINQRGEATCDGRAVVVLPPAGSDLAVLPEFDPGDVPEASAP
jgi:acyl dehydratase